MSLFTDASASRKKSASLQQNNQRCRDVSRQKTTKETRPREKRTRKEEEKTTYLGGEWDEPREVTPRVYEHFLTKKALFGVLAILVLFALVAMVMV